MKKLLIACLTMILFFSITSMPIEATGKDGYRSETVEGLPAYIKDYYVVAPFKDKQLAEGTYSYYASLWAKENGIISGYPDGSLKPNEKLTEAHWAKMLSNYFELPNKSGASISKRTSVSHWSNENYDALIHYEVPMLGYFDVQNRQQQVKRGVVAQSIAQLLGENKSLDASIQFLLDQQITVGQNPNGVSLVDRFGAHNYLTRIQGVTFLYRLFNADISASALKEPQKPNQNGIFNQNPGAVVIEPAAKPLMKAIEHLDPSLPDKKKGFKNFLMDERIPHTYSYKTNEIGYARDSIKGLKPDSSFLKAWRKVDFTKYNLYFSGPVGRDLTFTAREYPASLTEEGLDPGKLIEFKKFKKQNQDNSLRLASTYLSILGFAGTEEKLYSELKKAANSGKAYQQGSLHVYYYPIPDSLQLTYR
ncbi:MULTISPECIES: S-layer homology domain-containing protein [unclassified Sporosarcina]|uniref:S-layer homology domain-containing protein n=1 Tax=unclassified Sporosarcina TaxID=2647733 RepID=UPI0020402970|nr:MULTISPECIES: S-layer homology domain-containing protein [unclassified Sporosarcina]GKV67201.1 hypothetical protein NCCP2331_33540 [Sporosarcina sp. NCCP-2331]GLB57533.1 hypothetical protein NCCP2378_33220 [Sporosarcina sp. NCCP-2378]